MTKVGVTVNRNAKNKLLASYGPGSDLQKFVDMSVARHSDKYAPSDTAALRRSVFTNTIFGLGRLIYTIYGSITGRNTWNDDTSLFQDRPIRGPRWVERMLNNGGRERLYLEIMRFINRGKNG